MDGGNRALIAMSGGVDSSVAAWCMKEAGAACVGITLKLFSTGDASAAAGAAPARGCCSLADVNDARDVAYRLGIPHYVLNFTGEFRDQVIRRFIETYEGGAPRIPVSTVTATSSSTGSSSGPGSWISTCW